MSKQTRDDINRTVDLLFSIAQQLKSRHPFLAAMYKKLSEAIDSSQYGSQPSLQIELPSDSKTIILGEGVIKYQGKGLCTIEPDDIK